jgi:putative SOS response-associated peptidase YedK
LRGVGRIEPGDDAVLLRPREPHAPRQGLEARTCRWGLVPRFHHGPIAAWKAQSACAKFESLRTRDAFRRPFALQRALAPVSGLLVETVSREPGARPERWQVVWDPADEGDRVRFLPAIWELAQPRDAPAGLESFAVIVALRRTDDTVGRVRSWLGRVPCPLSLEEGLRWLDLHGSGGERCPPLSDRGALLWKRNVTD